MKNWICGFIVVVFIVGMAGGAFSAKKVKAPGKVVPKPAAKAPAEAKPAKPVEARSNMAVEGGLAGGALELGLSYCRPLSADYDLKANAGYGMGNKYSVILAGVGVTLKSNPAFFAGVGIDLANYSEKVADLPLMSASIDKGSRIGAGVFIGKNFGKWEAQAGYSTALGLNAAGRYYF